MNKSEKIEIIKNLIMKATNLSYDPNGEPQYSVIQDIQSSIRIIIFIENNAIEWKNRVDKLYWGVKTPRFQELATIRYTHWHEAQEKLIKILKSVKLEIEQFTSDDTAYPIISNNILNNKPLIFLSH
ncbi:MAG: hypothetical protein FWC01_08205 [Treponema sp.]|nr:hypothetical protein [Treponema sp.]MCL2237897.1 hypothetical protein [Treponema sp.]